MTQMTRAARSISALCLMALLSAGAFAASPPAAEESPAEGSASKGSMFRSAEDGQFDVSGFLDQAYGFLPIVMPITEPAVGAGAFAALTFLDRPQTEGGAGFGRPNITIVGGLATENGTHGVVLGDIRYWLDDRLQTLVGGIKSSVNLDYFGTGESGFRNRDSRSYTLDVEAALLQAKLRIGQTRNWVGLGYVLANTRASFDTPFDLPDAGRGNRLGGVLLSVSHDSRDNIFTTKDGNYLEISAAIFNPDFGGDLDFKRLSVVGMQYLPLAPKWTLGLREYLMFNYGNAPFYLQPYVTMRGVPAMRYQGEKVAQVEAEVRWQFWERVSAIGFVGAGSAVDEIRNLTRDSNVVAGGVGLRYEIARKYDIHLGFDVAWSRDGPAAYIQVGSAWMRP